MLCGAGHANETGFSLNS